MKASKMNCSSQPGRMGTCNDELHQPCSVQSVHELSEGSVGQSQPSCGIELHEVEGRVVSARSVLKRSSSFAGAWIAASSRCSMSQLSADEVLESNQAQSGTQHSDH